MPIGMLGVISGSMQCSKQENETGSMHGYMANGMAGGMPCCVLIGGLVPNSNAN